ncbi:MAG: hypothetical protein LBT46_06515 [Planctomycetaceae bacterium]|jgi:hypothetical protein|nr:hypothetical protein [Planctomycetaceae bacterium]
MTSAAKFPMSPPPKNETLAEFTKRYCESKRAEHIKEFDRYMAEKRVKLNRAADAAAAGIAADSLYSEKSKTVS